MLLVNSGALSFLMLSISLQVPLSCCKFVEQANETASKKPEKKKEPVGFLDTVQDMEEKEEGNDIKGCLELTKTDEQVNPDVSCIYHTKYH